VVCCILVGLEVDGTSLSRFSCGITCCDTTGLVGLTLGTLGGAGCEDITCWSFNCDCCVRLLLLGVVRVDVSLWLVDDEEVGAGLIEEDGDSSVVVTVFDEVGMVGSESVRKLATSFTQGVGAELSNVGSAICGTEAGFPCCI
jgi:hypothetical protein